jgi:hypothetical protein
MVFANCETDGFNRPAGTKLYSSRFQALRAWLLSCCPSGTKTITKKSRRREFSLRVRKRQSECCRRPHFQDWTTSRIPQFRLTPPCVFSTPGFSVAHEVPPHRASLVRHTKRAFANTGSPGFRFDRPIGLLVGKAAIAGYLGFWLGEFALVWIQETGTRCKARFSIQS